MRGTLTMISGVECSGKDTQIGLLQAEITARGIPIKVAREPGGTVIGDQIRGIFKDPTHATTINPLTSLFLINAARAQLVQEVFKPTMSQETHLLVNRSLICTIAYQGYAEGLPLRLVRDISWAAMADIMPDKIFVLDINMETMRKRIEARGGAALDRYDNKPTAFHEKVRDGYLIEARLQPTLIEVVDGERTEEEVCRVLLKKTLEVIHKKGR